ncbi:MAG TPA: trigger factor [Roseiflexaceae bacterium]|nr:trigger factor [Roseiflexaceae bacterium]
MKVTTEKLPKSLLALDIELDREQVEKGLDRAARRISQKYNIPGFRKGKAPRFIVENYVGRAALLDEASDDLLNKAFRAALEQEQIEPVGPAHLEHVNLDAEPFHFRVTVPLSPTVQLADYRAIRVPLEIPTITDEMVEEAMNERRERHVVLRDLEEERPVQDGDQLTVELDVIVDGKPLDEREPGTPPPPTALVMDRERLAPGLYDGLLGAVVGQTVAVISQMPADHHNERVAGKAVQFVVKVNKIQERLLPEWDELTTLEEFEGTLDELREKTRAELAEAARTSAERQVIDTYIERLVEQSTFDIPDVLIEREADRLLHNQEYSQYERYGVKAEQVYQLQNRKREDILQEMLPQGEERLKITLALREVVRAENLQIEDAEIDREVDRMVQDYEEQQRERARQILSTELRSSVASNVLDKKLRDRLLAIATGAEPPQPEPAAASETSGAGQPAPEGGAEEQAADAGGETQPVVAGAAPGAEDGERASHLELPR